MSATTFEIAIGLAALAAMIGIPFALLWFAGWLDELPPHVREALHASEDNAGADEGGVAR
jgi:hypothetical protein